MTAQVGGAAEGRGVGRREVACSVVSGQFLARRAGTRHGAGTICAARCGHFETVPGDEREGHGFSWPLLPAGLPLPAGGAGRAGAAGGRHPLCRRRPVRQPGRPGGRARAGRPASPAGPGDDRVQRGLPLAGRGPRRLPRRGRDGPDPPRHQGQRRGRAGRRRRDRRLRLRLSRLRRRRRGRPLQPDHDPAPHHRRAVPRPGRLASASCPATSPPASPENGSGSSTGIPSRWPAGGWPWRRWSPATRTFAAGSAGEAGQPPLPTCWTGSIGQRSASSPAPTPACRSPRSSPTAARVAW